MKTKIRLSISLKLWRDGKLILSCRRWIKERIIVEAQVRMWDKAYIYVFYRNDPDDPSWPFHNAGYCTNLDELKGMLSDFTEKGVLDYVWRKDGK